MWGRPQQRALQQAWVAGLLLPPPASLAAAWPLHCRCGFASKGGGKQSEDGGDGGASSIDRGARFAAQLTPAQLERMEVVLGAQPEGAASSSGQQQQQGGAPRYVTISTLQTHKHLPLPRELKQQLMAYQVVSLNRQMEELHGDCLALADELAEGGHGGGPLAPGTGKAPGGALGLLRQAAQAAQAPKGEPGSKAASGGG